MLDFQATVIIVEGTKLFIITRECMHNNNNVVQYKIIIAEIKFLVTIIWCSGIQ